MGNLTQPGASPIELGLQIKDYAMFGYFIAYLFYALQAFFIRKQWMGRLATLTLSLGWVLHTCFLATRAYFYYKQHNGFLLPATNMYEAISYFAWMIVLIYLITEQVLLKTRAFGVFALVIPLGAVAYAWRAMSPDPRELMPSLKSYWLVFHVTAMFISYATFALAATFALIYILRARGFKALEKLDSRFSLKFLDETSYRLVLAAFPVLTLGIFLGAVWADAAWGRYWGWDPKEVWALVTWLVYLTYVHLRATQKVIGYKASLLNLIGFVAVMVTFQGVNLLDKAFSLNSIHAYATGSGTFLLTVLGLGLIIPVLMHFMPAPKEDPAAPEAEEQLGTSVADLLKPGGGGMSAPTKPAFKTESSEDTAR